MKLEPYPLCFTPVYKSYVWGGSRMAAEYGRAGAPEVCAESWEISGHPEGMSRVKNGVYAGDTLDALAKRLGAQLIGRPLERFPLIFKLIDAREQLSVQVHPSDETAAKWGGEAKSEMWVVLGAGANGRATLHAGLREGADEAAFRAALADGTAPSLLAAHEVREGDALHIPGGLVHAIGAGCLVYEVQQSSNTTHRLYDWGRGRRVHIDEGLRVVDWNLAAPRIIHPGNGAGWRDVVRCGYFHMRQLAFEGEVRVEMPGGSFQALFVKRGTARVETNGAAVELAPGASALLPACCDSFTLAADGPAEILATTLGDFAC
ncbi:MAG: class I mannose-6-phosphate isomerase [Kiritimatiellaeota bacterium]|nr:class I mannose-6-phosphate isomerase [Kiritimatiellota bacterium]